MSRQKIHLVLEIEVDEPIGTSMYPHIEGITLLRKIQFDCQRGDGMLARWDIKCLCAMLENQGRGIGLFLYNNDPGMLQPILKRLNQINI